MMHLHRGDSPRALRFIGKSFKSCPLSWVRAPPGDNISILNIFPKNLNARGESPRCSSNYYSRLNCYSAADVCMGDWDQSYCIGGVGEESESDRDEREGLE